MANEFDIAGPMASPRGRDTEAAFEDIPIMCVVLWHIAGYTRLVAVERTNHVVL